MGKKKNKKSLPLKAASTFDIANYGVTKAPTAKGGTSSTSFTGGTPDWDKVTSAKTHMQNTMKLQEQNRKSLADKKAAYQSNQDKEDIDALRDDCLNKGGKWNPTTNTCIMPEGETPTETTETTETTEGTEGTPVENEKEVKVENEKEVKVENENVEIDDEAPVEEEEFSQELKTGKYKVKTATKVSLSNLFKKGQLKKDVYQFDNNTRKRKKGEMNSLLKKYKKKGKWTDPAKKAEYEKLKNERWLRKIKVKIPGEGWKTMTTEEFEENYADKLNLKTQGGRGFGESKPTRGGREYFSESQPVQFRSPMNFRSPFARRSRGYLKIRENWTPQQSVPMNYGSPLHQGQTDIQNQQFGSIWDKVQAYGSDMDEKVDKFIQHVSYNPDVDKPIKALQNQEWVVAITKWLQEQKSAMVKARTTKNSDEQQRVAAAVNTLIQDVVTYSGKFLSWMDRNSGDQAEGNGGGSVVSKGSKKDERFIGNITFMGDINTTVAVGPDGKLGIKSYGLDDVKFVEELDTDVFAKDDIGFMQFTKISEQLQKDAESGKPLNENVVKGNADQLLKNKDSVLSWAFDPLYGQSWLQDYAQGNPDANVDVFMPESPSFDIDYLTDELHGWLTSKLTESYTQNAPQQPEQKGDAAQGIMDQTLAGVEEEKTNKQGVYAEGGEQPAPEGATAQGPPQGSPMGYKKPRSSRAIELLRKYTK